MTITNTWAIANLERNVADGKVTTIHYTVTATDGTYQASAYGSIGVDGDITTPFKDLTADIVIGWVKDHFGADKVAEIEQALAEQIEQQRAPKTAAGLPW
jgi:hypothetical protein